MEATEIKLISSELFNEFGKEGALDSCYEMINRVEDENEIMFWKSVYYHIEKNMEDA